MSRNHRWLGVIERIFTLELLRDLSYKHLEILLTYILRLKISISPKALHYSIDLSIVDPMGLKTVTRRGLHAAALLLETSWVQRSEFT